MNRRLHLRPWLIGTVLITSALVVAALVTKSKPEQTLADGTVLRLEFVGYGTNLSYAPTPGWKLKLIEKLPPWVGRKLHATQHRTKLAPTPVLFLWLSRQNSAGMSELVAPAKDHQIVAEISKRDGGVFTNRFLDNVVLIDVPCSAIPASRPPFLFFSFEEFPRNDARLRMKLKRNQEILAEFEFQNPAFGHPEAGQ